MPLAGDFQLPVSLLRHAPHHPDLLLGLVELLLHALSRLDGLTQLCLEGGGPLLRGPVAIAVHDQVPVAQLGEGNQMTAIAKVRGQLASPDTGANCVLRKAGEFRRLSYVNRWGF
jgi:hypothetical protein